MWLRPFGIAFGIAGKPRLPYVENLGLRICVFLRIPEQVLND
jgi:hypothetical protein